MRLRDALISTVLVGVDGGSRVDVIGDKSLESFAVGVVNMLDVNFISRLILDANDNGLTSSAASLIGSERLIFLGTTDVGFIDFYGSDKADAIDFPGLPDAVGEMS